MNIKICNKCDEIKLDQLDFYIHWEKNRFCYRNYCRDCEKEYDKQYRKNNVEHLKQHRKVNAEYKKEYDKQYYQDNIEHKKEHKKQYYQNNVEHEKQRNKQWCEDNPEKIRTHKRKYRALKNGASGYHTEKDLQYIYEQQKGKCISCKVKIPYNKATVDHIKPLSKGGSDLPYNIQLLCKSCNSSKGNYHATDYREFETAFLRNKSSIRMVFKEI